MVMFMEKTNSKSVDKKQKDNSYNRVVLWQVLLSAAVLALLVFLGGTDKGALKQDYKALMQWDISDKLLESAETVKQLFAGENMWAVQSAGVTLYDGSTDADAQETETVAESETLQETQTSSADESGEISDTTAVSAMGGVDLESYEAAENTSFAPVKTTAKILSPIENPRYTSYFGYRTSPITGEWSFHTGLDMAAAQGTKIRAAFSGTVSKVGEDSRAGKYIFLTHSDGFVTFYCHCSEILAQEGANIRQGETIAKVGSTGWSTGPHLHFEVRKDSVRLNPLWLLENDC